MTQIIFYSIVLGVWSFLFCGPLNDKGEAFNFVPRFWLWWTGEKEPSESRGFNYWLAKVSFFCAKCHAGFVGLSLIVWRLQWLISFDLEFDPAMFSLNAFSFWVLSVFTAYFLSEKLH